MQLIDVVVAVRDLKAFRRLVISVDSQSVPASAFGVVAVPVGLTDTDLAQLRTLAEHRPNLIVADEPSPWWSAALSTSDADYILPMADDERVAPGALQRVLDGIVRGPDALVGRAVMTGGSTDWAVFADGVAPDRDLLGRSDMDRMAVVMRSDLLSGNAPRASVPEVRRAALAATSSVQILRGDPLLLGVVGQARPNASGVTTHQVMATGTWADGTLRLQLSWPAPDDEGTYMVLRSLETGLDWRLPLQPSGESATVVVDPLTAGGGRPLAAGRWVLDLHEEGPEMHAVAWTRSPGSALLADLVVAAVRGVGGRVVLDVGATRRSPLRDMDAATAQIHEDARGTRLDWVLPFAHVTGEASLPAVVNLGNFPLRAELVSRGQRASLGTWLSGLPSRSAVAVSVAGSPFHATGHDLVIAHTGEMELLRTPREPRVARGGPAGAPRTLPTEVRRVLGRIASLLRPST
jgi:hypothetical protein